MKTRGSAGNRGWTAIPRSPRSPPEVIRPPMSRSGVPDTTPFETIQMRPSWAAMKRRPEPSGGATMARGPPATCTYVMRVTATCDGSNRGPSDAETPGKAEASSDVEVAVGATLAGCGLTSCEEHATRTTTTIAAPTMPAAAHPENRPEPAPRVMASLYPRPGSGPPAVLASAPMEAFELDGLLATQSESGQL